MDRLQISQDQALSLIPVYRAIQIISSAVSQLTIDVERNKTQITPPAWVRQPDVKMTSSAFLELTATSLAATGNAFWRVERDSAADAPSALVVLNPHEVHVHDDGSFSHRGRDLKPWRVRHLQLMRVPGLNRGLGPIQACSADLRGAVDQRDYATEWFDTGTVPNGVLSSDQHITADQAKGMKERWVSSVNGREPVVLGQGMAYHPLLLSPKDSQFLETRQFSVTDIARLFGIPAHLMHAVVQGGSMTYMSGQAADLSFVRWTLMSYLREIEEAVTALLPRGQKARFNVNAILRPATKERYEAHRIALETGFLTVNEVRQIEDRDPLSDEELKAAVLSRPGSSSSSSAPKEPA
ncbi:phage portal protein [Tessaracoccus sp. MC1865]|uniref:phage portal protein n=1 Tax=Tessaracoccus sp. MC1865 TaxID=2760310 RepID=UPI0015FEDD3C|nr:phage portal protein [Tessaracoccus sp. MC1865]MBB1482499.1 phage portal protein [Tessaracoccus sp. MC1865]QTO38046.1 phage portal protein [Tessaracoccus sp. MC1865]